MEWLALSTRSLSASHGSTSATSTAPASSHGGRAAAKSSSITHCRNGSATTAASSRNPVRVRTSVRSSAVVAGTIRSTIVAGNRMCSDTHAASSASPAASMNCCTSRRRVRPLAGRLSQLTTVTGPAPVPARRCSPRTS